MKKKIFCSVCSVLLLASMPSSSVIASPSADIVETPDSLTITMDATSRASASFFDTIVNLISEKGASIVKNMLPTVGDFLCAKVFSALGIDYTDSYTAEITKIYAELTSINTKLDEVINQFNLNTLREFNKSLKAVSKAVMPTYKTYDQLRADELAEKYTVEQAKKEEGALYNIVEAMTTEVGNFYPAYQNFLDLIVSPDSTNPHKSLMEFYSTCFKSQWGFDTEALRNKKNFLTQISIVAYQGFALWTYAYYYNQENSTIEADKNQHKNTYTQMQNYAEPAFKLLQSELNAVIKTQNEGLSTGQVTHYNNNSTKTGRSDVRVSTRLYNGKIFSYRPREGISTNASDPSNYFSYERDERLNRYHGTRNYYHKYLMNLDLGRQIAADYNAYKTRTKQGNSFTLSKYMTHMGFSNASDSATGLYIGQQYRHKGNFFTNEYYYWDLIYIDQNGKEQTANYCSVVHKVRRTRTLSYTEHCTDSFFAIVDPSGYLHGNYEERKLGMGDTGMYQYYALSKPKTYKLSDKLGKVF